MAQKPTSASSLSASATATATVSGGVITTVAGNGMPGFSGDNGPATSAQLLSPEAVAVDFAPISEDALDVIE